MLYLCSLVIVFNPYLYTIQSFFSFSGFFQVFFCVVVYGLFHGLCYLPVLLSAIGPAPYESAQSHHDGKGTRSRSPVHPTGLPGDNVSYELAVANGKGTPQKSAQNGGYPIPPPEYQGDGLNSYHSEFCFLHYVFNSNVVKNLNFLLLSDLIKVSLA